jgi:hypothetical protein
MDHPRPLFKVRPKAQHIPFKTSLHDAEITLKKEINTF